VSQYPDHIEIANPGEFIGGVSPDNILRHRPVPRNPLLVNALVRLRLVNHMNLGVRRGLGRSHESRRARYAGGPGRTGRHTGRKGCVKPLLAGMLLRDGTPSLARAARLMEMVMGSWRIVPARGSSW